MLAQNESPIPATSVGSCASRKMLQLLRKRLRQLARVTLVIAICLALLVSGFAIWWLRSLNGLPDIGDPFDVAAFRDFRLPDDQNAFAFVRRANETLTPGPFSSPSVPWSKADPKLREWVESNRMGLELFQRGADQADAARLPGDLADVRYLMGLALVEGSKRQESGDEAGAWECYRAVLRMTSHVRRRGSLNQLKDLNRGIRFDRQEQRLATWAADPRTTILQLQIALDEALKNEPRPDWYSCAIKDAYLEMMNSLTRPIGRFAKQEAGWGYDYHLGDMRLSDGMVDRLEAVHRFVLREPERSQRVLRLLCANWLAHVETPELWRRQPAVFASFPLRASSNPIRNVITSVPIYSVNPVMSTGARSLPPHELARWLVSTNDAKLRILMANSYLPWSPANHFRDRRAHCELVIMLATEIYHREHGSLPPSDEALVGTYLKSLPDDGASEIVDEPTPIMSGSGASAPPPPK